MTFKIFSKLQAEEQRRNQGTGEADYKKVWVASKNRKSYKVESQEVLNYKTPKRSKQLEMRDQEHETL